MSSLFIVEGSIAKPNPETLLIEPFKTIWERDKDVDKSMAIKEFTYMELMSSKKRSNPYAGYTEEMRKEKLMEMLFSKYPDWKLDSLVEQGMAEIVTFQTEASPTYSYYISVLGATEKMKQFFNDFDINEVNEKGARVFKPNEIIMAIANTDKLLQNLNSMKEKVEQELFEQSKTRGMKQINPFEE